MVAGLPGIQESWVRVEQEELNFQDSLLANYKCCHFCFSPRVYMALVYQRSVIKPSRELVSFSHHSCSYLPAGQGFGFYEDPWYDN